MSDLTSNQLSPWLRFVTYAEQITAPCCHDEGDNHWRVRSQSGGVYRALQLSDALKDFWECEIRHRDLDGNPTEPEPIPAHEPPAVPAVTALDQYRCQPEKQTYCPHMDMAHALLAEWLKAWDAGSDKSLSLYERTRVLLRGRTSQPPAASQWQPIETAPKDGYFLVWCPDEKIGGLVEHWSAKNFHDAAMRKQWAHLGIPSHWMPIPEAPRS